MKKYEFKNYMAHKSAEVHVDQSGRNALYIVWYDQVGKVLGSKQFASEAAAVESAINHVVGEERK